jgi:heme/copper-type cytochrome/quinol oxidase subunit 2
VIGPALKGVYDRRSEEWIIKFVHNSQAVIKSGDEYAVKLYNEYNQTVMTAFPQLKDDQIRSIIAYIKEAETAKAAAAAPAAGGGAQGGVSAETTQALVWALGGLIVVLVAVCVVLLVVIAVIMNVIRAREKGETAKPADIMATIMGLARNKFVLTVVVLLLVIVGTDYTIKTATNVGLHQNYAPIQPIAFSHKIHAGQYGISCNYCHIGVEKGKSATIPGTNICMNCHNYIQQGTNTGEKEIAKIIESYNTQTPIEWVRIHNLPDLVYFNHAQHVKVGGIECNKCHGDEAKGIKVQDMEVVYQAQNLSMGWCVNCHRETKVDVTKSEYYRTVHDEWNKKLEEARKEGKELNITVEKLGGLECAKCHY